MLNSTKVTHALGCDCPGCTNPEYQPESISLDPFAGQTYANKPIATEEQAADTLSRTGWNWTLNNYGELADGVLNFGFWANPQEIENSYYVDIYGKTAFSEALNARKAPVFDEAQKALARQAMDAWDDVIGISFQETRSAAADITFGNTLVPAGAGAYAYLPFGDIFDSSYEEAGFEEIGRLSGDVWIGYFGQSFFTKPGFYDMWAMTHEIGHSLGLSHPGDYDATDDNDGDGQPDPITYAGDALYAQDSLQYSTMSYFDAYETGAQHIDFALMSFVYPQTPMVHDVLSVQAIYGADMTTRTGDTVYGFNATEKGSLLDFTFNTRPIVTIWDAGGTDTIDFSGWKTPSVIDLNDGAFSSGGGVLAIPTLAEVNAARAAIGLGPRSQALYDDYVGLFEDLKLENALFTDNVSIAYGAVIENAVGGGGDDLIVANDAVNRLTGGAGSDTVSYETAGTGVRVTLANGRGFEGAEGDRLIGIENLVGSAFNDTLSGNAGRNTLAGGLGLDKLTGGGGADTFDLSGATGTDRIFDFGGGDVLITDKAIGTLTMGSNATLLLGDGDRAVLAGKAGGSVRFLGVEDGVFYYGDGAVRPTASGAGQNVVEGLIGDDKLTGSASAATTDIFFYDTANAAPGTGDDVVTLTARDLFVTTTALVRGNDNRVEFNDFSLDLTGNGGTVRFETGESVLTAIEFDGAVTRDGVTYFVYSRVGSDVGTADLVFP